MTGAAGSPRPRVVWTFSGQGSQSYGMARELFETEPAFRKTFLELSSFIEPELGSSLADIIYSAPPSDAAGSATSTPRVFDNILHTHPALFITQYAMAEMMLARGWRPDAVLGYSLGEFVAAAVTEVMTPRQALGAVMRSARILKEKGPAGTMAAILTRPDIFEAEQELFAPCVLAASNTARHFVISGPAADIERIRLALKARSIQLIPLPISYPFHSPYMEVVRTEFLAILQDIRMRKPRVPFYSCQQAARVGEFGSDFFWNVTLDPVDFRGALAAAERDGPWTYLDLGPSGTLCSFARQNLLAPSKTPGAERSRSEAITILSPFGQDLLGLAAAEKHLGAVGSTA